MTVPVYRGGGGGSGDDVGGDAILKCCVITVCFPIACPIPFFCPQLLEGDQARRQREQQEAQQQAQRDACTHPCVRVCLRACACVGRLRFLEFCRKHGLVSEKIR